MINYYVGLLSNPDSLRGSFGWYRALEMTIAQNEQRKTKRLTMPVLAIGGAESFGEHVGDATRLVADDVQSVVIYGNAPRQAGQTRLSILDWQAKPPSSTIEGARKASRKSRSTPMLTGLPCVHSGWYD